MSNQEAKTLSREEAEKKWEEYLLYLERCRQNRWIPARPSKAVLEVLGKTDADLQNLTKR